MFRASGFVLVGEKITINIHARCHKVVTSEVLVAVGFECKLNYLMNLYGADRMKIVGDSMRQK